MRKRSVLTVCTATVVVSVLAGCLTTTVASAATTSNATTHTVSPPTSSVDVNVGDTVVVRMSACYASCGYSWVMTRRPDPWVVTYLSTTYADQSRPPGMVGGNQTESVTMRARHAGTAYVAWGYRPPAAGATPTQFYRLTIRVHSPATFSYATKSAPTSPAGAAVQAWRIRTGNDGSFDRVVFDERNGLSGYTVQYVALPIVGGRVPAIGGYLLQVTLMNTSASVPRVVSPGLPRVAHITNQGDFEHSVTFMIAVNGHPSFRVLRLTSPDRLVVDLHH